MLKLVNIQSGYGAIPVLHDVNIHIGAGEIITLIGANGAGKTTTLMTVCGLVEARSGEILFEDRRIQSLPANKIVEMGIVQVPEGRLIFPELTVLENLDMGAFLRHDTRENPA